MDKISRPERRRRWLAWGLAGLGALGLGWALWRALRVVLSQRAAGHTAGGAATWAELCSRSVPADLAAACQEASRQKAAAAWRPVELVAVLGVVLVALAAGVGSSARRHRSGRSG